MEDIGVGVLAGFALLRSASRDGAAALGEWTTWRPALLILVAGLALCELARYVRRRFGSPPT